MRKFVTILGAIVLTLGLAGGASAGSGKPFRGTFDDGFVSFVDTEVCASAPWEFDVTATEHEYGFFEVWEDDNGNFLRAIVHFNYDAWISANGKTIVERDTWTAFFGPNGSRDVGLTVHIQGPGGIVVRDAGQIVQDADGNVIAVKGPHEQFSGVSFCPAIAP
jgi:hypothetical protein